jgi:serine/threonine protein kinase
MQPGQKYGKYLLLERIAHGGMAEIFKAKAIGAAGFEKRVAIKRLHSRFAEDRDVIAMLQDEARLVSELTHQNICGVHDLGRVEDTYYIAMDFVDGENLARVMRRANKEFARALPYSASLFIMREMLSGLDYAHRKRGRDGNPLGIIHRDISPQNVLVSFEGEVKIIDFGIAKAKNQSHNTEAGVIKGKFRYMSPEQARGERIDHRADIFAAGVVLYELILGHPHSKGLTDMQVLTRIQQGIFDPLDQLIPDLPPALAEIVDRALAPHPEQRWPTAGHFKRSLEGFIDANGLSCNRDNLSVFMRKLFPEQWQRGTEVEGVQTVSPGDMMLDSYPAGTQELDLDQVVEISDSPSPGTGKRLETAATAYATPLSGERARHTPAGRLPAGRTPAGSQQDTEATAYETPLSRTPAGMQRTDARAAAAADHAAFSSEGPVEGHTTRQRRLARQGFGDPRRKKLKSRGRAQQKAGQGAPRGPGRLGAGGGPPPELDRLLGTPSGASADLHPRDLALEQAWQAAQRSSADYPDTEEDSAFGPRAGGAVSDRNAKDRRANKKQKAAVKAAQKKRKAKRFAEGKAKVHWGAVIGYAFVFLLLLGGVGVVGYNYFMRPTPKKAPPPKDQAPRTVSEPTIIKTNVDISSKPKSGAQIYINGRKTEETTPAAFEIQAPSPVLIELVRKGFPRWVQQFPIEPGVPLKIEADLRHPPKRAVAETRQSTSRRAAGRRRRPRTGGRRRRRRTGSAATHRRIQPPPTEARGGRTYGPESGGLVDSPDLATLEINSSERAWVFINGRKMGYTKLIKRLRPGTYKVWIQKGNANSSARTVTVGKGQTKKIFLQLGR